MRVAVVSSFDLDGGAARAAYRLHGALRERGVDSRMFVQVRTSGDTSVDGPSVGVRKLIARMRPIVDQLPGKWMGSRLGEYSVNWLPGDLLSRLEQFNPDVVHLHWVNAGFVSLGQIGRIRRPVVWTAHDMWPFTGGCHYDKECGRYSKQGCFPCPLLTRGTAFGLAQGRLRTKQLAATKAQISFISPSRWLAAVAKSSPVTSGCDVSVVPNGIDLDRFKAIDKSAARALFALPADKTILLFGAVNSNADPRKGFNQLDAMLRHVAASALANSVVLCVYGTATKGVAELHGIPVRYVGHLHDDESLIALYSAADIFLAPSLQDNLPNTVLEATACGLPTIAFNIGGMPDLIDDGRTGFLADSISAEALFDCLQRAIGQPGWMAAASQAARQLAESRFSSVAFAESHIGIYERVVSQ